MKEKTFERELPHDYRLDFSIDATKGKAGWLLTLASLPLWAIFTALPIGVYVLLFGTSGFDWSTLIGVPVLLCCSLIVYTVLHELVHGVAYKLLTHEELTFGISWSCAFCGVPKIFTYRKTALKSVLAPLVLFTVLLLVLMGLSVNSFCIYITLSVVFGGHIGGCVGDAYVAWLLLFKYKDNATLMNDTGPRMSFFVKDEIADGAFDEATAAFLAVRQTEETKTTARQQRVSPQKEALGYAIAGIVLFVPAIILFAVLAFEKSPMLYPLGQEQFYERVSFWVMVLLLLLTVNFIFTPKKQAATKKRIVYLFVFLILPVAVFSLIFDSTCYISYTTDIAHYGSYDRFCDLFDDVPDAITEDMTPVAYSYYYDYSWDYCYEHYLEVQMTNAAYQELKERYMGKTVPCWYADGYEEYVCSDDLGDFEQTYTDHPNIKKIIFCDANNTVIYVTLYGIDPFYFENSYYFARFSLNPGEYYEKTSVRLA